jgi:hypothetical protein
MTQQKPQDNVNNFKDYRLSSDTTPEAEELLFELLSKKSPTEKLRMVCDASATVRTLAMSGLSERYPLETEMQLKIRLAELLYGADVAAEIAKKLMSTHTNE